LSKIYPSCKFIAADASAEINEDLVKNTLGGTFINVAVGGKTLEQGQTFVFEYSEWDYLSVYRNKRYHGKL
jgi:hypothetical protein